jgi:hypothetical protein
MLLLPGGRLNLATWALAAACTFGLLPFVPRISWSSSLGGGVLLVTTLNAGCRWWGLDMFVNPDPLPRVSWWWQLLLLVLYVLTALMQAAEQLRREEEAAKQGGRPGASSFAGEGAPRMC